MLLFVKRRYTNLSFNYKGEQIDFNLRNLFNFYNFSCIIDMLLLISVGSDLTLEYHDYYDSSIFDIVVNSIKCYRKI